MKAQTIPPPRGQVPSLYELSHLYWKPPTYWEAKARELTEDKPHRSSAYRALRSAIIVDIKNKGKGRPILEAGLRNANFGFGTEAIVEANFRAFHVFETKIRNRITSLEADYVHPPANNVFKLGGFPIVGGLHAKVRLRSGESKYIYFHPSEWEHDEVHGHQELLVILGEQVHGIDAHDILWCDLRAGTMRQLAERSLTRVRLERANQHYHRLFGKPG